MKQVYHITREAIEHDWIEADSEEEAIAISQRPDYRKKVTTPTGPAYVVDIMSLAEYNGKESSGV